MRDPNRLDEFYDEMKELHKKHFPDWRFGQLMHNFFGWIMTKKKVDGFYTEENRMIEWLKEYTENSMWNKTEDKNDN